MKLSAYTHEFDLPDGSYVLANLLWQSFMELDDHERAVWTDAKAQGRLSESSLAPRLVENKVLIDDGVDELGFMHDLYSRKRHRSDVLGLTIAPTIDCNFACIYCYENKRKGSLTDEVAGQIRAYVEQMLPGRKYLNVIWYGGEPLMCKPQVYALSRFFREFAAACGCTYTADMTTNAFLLDPETARAMHEIGGWRKIQITLDGLDQDHDSRRPARGGQPTFQRVYSNLVKASECLPVSLRMNVDTGNVDGCFAVLRKLAQDADPGRIHVYIAPTHFFGKGCRDIADSGEISIFDHQQFAKISLDFVALARALGFKTDNELNKRTVSQCQAVSTHSLIIEPDGGLQRCWTEVGDHAKRIGHISQPVNMTQENVLRWLRFDPTTTDPCRSCDVLPTCFGGCPQRHLDGRPSEVICAGIRFQTKETLRRDYIAKYRPDLSDQHGRSLATSACGTCAGKVALPF